MGSLFSSKKKQDKKPSQQQPPQQKKQLSEAEKCRIKLQHQRDKLREKRKQIEVNLTSIESQIKNLLSENKRDQAKHMFQRKMLYDKFLETTLQKESFIAQQIQSVDQLMTDKEMADIVIQTNQVMKDMQASIDIDKLQDAMLDMQENRKQEDQMNDMYKQYQVDDQAEIDAMYKMYEDQSAQNKYNGQEQQNKNQEFVPLPQQSVKFVPLQQQTSQQTQKPKKQDQEQLAMLE